MNDLRPVVAVLSQVQAGHVGTYHRLFVERFAAQGCRVASLLPTGAWWDRMLRQLDRSERLQGWRAWRGAARQVWAWERANAASVAAVFFVYLDQGFLNARVSVPWVDRCFPWPWAGVVTGPAAVRRPAGTYAGRERVLSAQHCRAAVVTDAAFAGPCAEAWPGRRIVVMPEAADRSAPAESAALRRLREFAGGRRLVGLVGVISAKKNVASFLALARRARVEQPDTAFVIAGDLSSAACPRAERREMAALLAGRPDNCWFYGQPIPDGPEFNGWVCACDVVWLAYRDVAYNSNVLTKAAHFARPVLVSPGAVMAAHVARFHLGEVVDAADTPAVLAALRRLLAAPAEGRDFAGFAAETSVDQLDGAVRTLREALGL